MKAGQLCLFLPAVERLDAWKDELSDASLLIYEASEN
jgi:hypothetical protein